MQRSRCSRGRRWPGNGAATLLVCSLGLGGAAAHASEYDVPGDYDTIQAAIDACADGDVVVVADGSYSGPGFRDLDFGGRLITVRSESRDPALCVLDCQQSGRGFIFRADETDEAIVQGFTIRQGFAVEGGGFLIDGASPMILDCVIDSCYGDIAGGGAHVSHPGRPTFERCTFQDNTTIGDGGGVYAWEASPVLVGHCTFDGNVAWGRGGAMYVGVDGPMTVEHTTFLGNSSIDDGGALWLRAGPFTLDDCTFRENETQGGAGGAIFAHAATLDLQDVVFDGNVCNWVGGAVRTYGGSVTATDSTFTLNQSNGSGGAMYLGTTQATLTRCDFEDNSDLLEDGAGGAVTSSNGGLDASWCTFTRNVAGHLGGGLANSEGTAEVTDCTFTDNSSTFQTWPDFDGGGAIANAAGGTLTATRCTFTGNSAFDSGGAILNIEGGTLTISGGTFTLNEVDAGGGGAVCSDVPMTISGSRFEANRALNVTGGAVYGCGAIKECVFLHNSSVSSGGAVYGRQICGETTVTSCTFLGNEVELFDSGALALRGPGRVANSLFSGNRVLNPSGEGGAIGVGAFSGAVIANCTMRGNTAGDAGGGVASYASTEIVNCILWENLPDEILDEDGTVTVRSSIVQGGWTGSGAHVLDTDPLLADPDGPDGVAGTEDDDLRLRCVSPCIDAGDSGGVPPDLLDLDDDGDVMEPLPLDLDRRPRFADHPLVDDTGIGDPPIVDMGAFEFPASSCPADFDANGDVDFPDLLLVLATWGPCPGCPQDLDCDEDVGFTDLLAVLSTWGPCP
jgi:predicted outer membrane repeat protein